MLYNILKCDLGHFRHDLIPTPLSHNKGELISHEFMRLNRC